MPGVIHALRKFNRARARQGGGVYVRVEPDVRVYCDQWRRPKDHKQDGPSSSPQKMAEAPAPSSVSSTPVLTPKKRLATEVLHKLRTNKKELMADKGGVVITSDPTATNGKVQFTVNQLKEDFIVRFNILNQGTNSIHFTYYAALHRIRRFPLVAERRVTRACPLSLCPGESYEVVVQYRLNSYGHFPATMYFEFCPDPPGSKTLCIVREMEAIARTPLAMDLEPVAPYKPYQVATYEPVSTVMVEGVPPESSAVQHLKMTLKLGDYRYPAYLKDLAKRRLEDSRYHSPTVRQKLTSVSSLRLPPGGLLNCLLKMRNYAQRLHLLLHLEEIQMEVDIRKCDLHSQTMTRDRGNKKLLNLRVPGVAENRPSVLRGDRLRVSKSEDTVQPITVYTGSVHRVELDSVKLGFSKKLVQNFISNMKFSVEFTLNRFPMKMQHRAKHQLEEVLFPSGPGKTSISLPTLRLVSGGVPSGHFTHVFVDESGQASEPECIVAVAGLLHPQKGQLVLAGDPQQLGPIHRSPLALQYGLGLSLLERLMRDNALYKKNEESGNYDNRFVTKLLQNYRSRPAILKIPNELFYENELQVFADTQERQAYCYWERLPRRSFQVIFNGLMGKDEREANSPSFFNVSEIEVLVEYLNKLWQTQGKKGIPKLCPKDIGIITPYRKQVEKIRKALKSISKLNQWNDLQELKVG
ncbi:LOW QUALITY PROTEIN: putative helicase mov-10-B.2 [Lampris incognitus]|uniref:LOW QUALITY PROTEIN: putative helicase mov-10-B.2 n=1 Tax=Lampris incognitus TaxID=2546036 RepID=UPI0024B48DA5|nr:LOW QUALITY PROTEIN: putative helicase mov-10-B.2 [Lampris incognitus]